MKIRTESEQELQATPNVVMTLLVRDEEDILDWNLRFHYSQGISFIIATDNRSTDSSPDILRQYERQGKLHYIREDRDDYSQAIWVTRMARLAAHEYQADWVINSDADEFWLPLEGNLPFNLGKIEPETGCIECKRHNFTPISGFDTSSEPFWQQMIFRQVHSSNATGQPLPGKVCHRGSPHINVMQGNHAVDGIPGGRQACRDIEILHFPIRNFKQFENKISLGGAAYARNSTLPTSIGSTWRYLYEIYQAGRLREWYENQLLPKICSVSGDPTPNCHAIDTRLHDFFLQENFSVTLPNKNL